MSVSANTDKPSCFGTMWDPKALECRGGADPSYVDKRTGNNVREQCSFFGACGNVTQAKRLEVARTQQIISPQQLVRPEVQRFQTSTPSQPTYQPQQPQQLRVFTPSAPVQQYRPAPQEHYDPGHYQPMPVNYAMPGYLSVPETRTASEGILAFAARSIARSMLKGGAHGLAHLIDVTPLKRTPPKSGSENG